MIIIEQSESGQRHISIPEDPVGAKNNSQEGMIWDFLGRLNFRNFIVITKAPLRITLAVTNSPMQLFYFVCVVSNVIK